FPSGSMFWARSAALRPLLDLNLSYGDFPEEAGQIDGTPAHAIERLYYYACERAGFTWLKVAHPELFAHTPAIVPIDSAPALDRFISKHGRRLPGDDLPEPRAVHPPGLLRPAKGLISRLGAKALGRDLDITQDTRVAIGIVVCNNEPDDVRRIV